VVRSRFVTEAGTRPGRSRRARIKRKRIITSSLDGLRVILFRG
jgi:hypothetical protein